MVPSTHLRQYGREIAVQESPPADGPGWHQVGPRGRIVVAQALGDVSGHYVWGVSVRAADGALVLYQPLPMRTRDVTLHLPAGDYEVATFRHACGIDCSTIGPPTTTCSSAVYLAPDSIVELAESSPSTNCRMRRDQPPPTPAVASLGVRWHGGGGWVLEVVNDEVPLAAPVEAVRVWVTPGEYQLSTRPGDQPSGGRCISELEAPSGVSVEVVHSLVAGGECHLRDVVTVPAGSTPEAR